MAEGIFVNTITEVEENGGSPISTVYNIEAQRMSQGNVGSLTTPVYFLDGVPTECEVGAGGGGGDTIEITPDPTIASLTRNKKTVIATFKINDEEEQELCVEKVTSGYQKQTLFAGSLNENTGNGNGAALTVPFTNFEYLYIYIQDTKKLVGTKVITVPTTILKDRLREDAAYVSCDLYGTLGMILKFTSPTGVKVEYINNLPNYGAQDGEDNDQISVICSKIEGITLGISSGSWGKNTKDTLWSGTVSSVDVSTKYSFSEEDPDTHELKKLKNYDSIYVYGHILGEDEEHVDIGAVDFLAAKLESDKAILTCGSLSNITKTLKFNNDGFYVIAGNNVESLTYIITQIDGIKYGVDVKGGGDVDTSDCMKRGVHNVTNGIIKDEEQNPGYLIPNNITYEEAENTRITIEGGKNGIYWPEESLKQRISINNSHIEGECNQLNITNFPIQDDYNYYLTGIHIEGCNNKTDITLLQNPYLDHVDNLCLFSPVSPSSTISKIYLGTENGTTGDHLEGQNNKIIGGNFNHCEGWENVAGTPIYPGYQTILYQSDPLIMPSDAASITGHEHVGPGSCYGCHAEGYKTTAFSTAAHTEGIGTLVGIVGINNTSENLFSYSWQCLYGLGGHAEGVGTSVLSEGSHAEGGYTLAGNYNLFDPESYDYDFETCDPQFNGAYAHAEGYGTSALQDFSHSGGYYTVANDEAQTVIGRYNVIDNNNTYAFIIGNGSSDGRSNAFAVTWNGGIEINGMPFVPGSSYVLPAATSNDLGGIKLGNGFSLDNNDALTYSMPTATSSTVGGVKIGNGINLDTSTGTISVSPGDTITITPSLFAGTPIATYSINGGSAVTLYAPTGGGGGGDISTCMIKGIDYVTAGEDTSYYEPIGSYATAEGYNVKAIGDYSHAEGFSCLSNGEYAHAEGKSTKAGGDYSHAEGEGSRSYSAGSHAEGYYTTSFGEWSHSEGMNTSAKGQCSHAEGAFTSATNTNSLAIGHYNAAMTTGGTNTNQVGTAFVIGNGSNSTTGKSNAFSVEFSGTALLNNATVQTADYAEFFEWADENINEEDRVGLFVTFDDNEMDKIRIANAEDDYILGIVSGAPAILGNADCSVWNGMYLVDDFGRKIMEENEDGDLVPKINPEYDYTLEYISRRNRAEWAPIGMLGVLAVKDDGTCIPGKYCKIAEGGIATYQERYNRNENCYRVTERVSENVIKVVFK